MLIEYSQTQVFTSTGATAWQDAYTAQEHALTVEAASASSCTVVFETRRSGGTVAIQQGSAINLNASSGTTIQFTGAYYQTRARVTDMTGTVTLQLVGN
jgi:hypothetical protein